MICTGHSSRRLTQRILSRILGAAQRRRPHLPEIVLWTTASRHPSESQTRSHRRTHPTRPPPNRPDLPSGRAPHTPSAPPPARNATPNRQLYSPSPRLDPATTRNQVRHQDRCTNDTNKGTKLQRSTPAPLKRNWGKKTCAYHEWWNETVVLLCTYTSFGNI